MLNLGKNFCLLPCLLSLKLEKWCWGCACFEQVLQLLALEETSDRVKADRLNRLMSKSHDFDYAAMDDDQQEEYCSSDDFLSGLQSQATELELNQSQVGPV
jgi:hypothetical protein